MLAEAMMAEEARPDCRNASPVRFSPEAIQQVIENECASQDLQCLIASGCDRAAQLGHLAMIHHLNPRIDMLDSWVGQNRRQLKARTQHFTQVANELESLNALPFKALLAERADAPALFAVASNLRHYVSVCADLLSEVSGQRHLHQDMSVAMLVRYVFSSTERFHDGEISALVAAVLHKDYSEKVHRAVLGQSSGGRRFTCAVHRRDSNQRSE